MNKEIYYKKGGGFLDVKGCNILPTKGRDQKARICKDGLVKWMEGRFGGRKPARGNERCTATKKVC